MLPLAKLTSQLGLVLDCGLLSIIKCLFISHFSSPVRCFMVVRSLDHPVSMSGIWYGLPGYSVGLSKYVKCCISCRACYYLYPTTRAVQILIH